MGMRFGHWWQSRRWAWMVRPFCVVGVLALAAPFSFAWAAPVAEHAGYPALRAVLSRDSGLDAAQVDAIMAGAELRPSIIAAMTRPAEAKPWHAYRPIFLTERRIADGIAFWTEHASLLARLEAEYRVPAEIMVAIVGVETGYGANVGRYPVVEALATLALDYPPRADFFRKELVEFLRLARDEQWEQLSAVGSYAGAMGMPQFIPSSYRAYAVDGDGDGRRDLWASTADVLASVANYFRQHRWQWDGPVLWAAGDVPEHLAAMASTRASPAEKSLSQWRAAGVRVVGDGTTQATLYRFDQLDGPEYLFGGENFWVITRYNRSPLYARAVWELAQAIRQGRAQAGGAES